MRVFRIALFIPLLTLASGCAAETSRMSSAQAAQLVADGSAVLVDVREPNEWAETGVAAPAVLLPKSDFDGEQKQWKPFLQELSGKRVVLYCRTGRRSEAVAQALAKQGVNVANAGGFSDWKNAGLPVVQPSVPATHNPAPGAQQQPRP